MIVMIKVEEKTNIPLGLELLDAYKGSGDAFVGQDGIVLLERALADFRVVCLRDGVLEEGLFEFVEGDEDAKDLG